MQPTKTLHIVGVPLRSGSLMPGTENDAAAYRDAGLSERLGAAGWNAIDEGDLEVPSYLPHHTVPPVRNWLGPRVVWDLLVDRMQGWLNTRDHIPLLIGCDCSVVVGSCQALMRSADEVHVLYIDGDFDDAPPDPQTCQSAAAMAAWLMTHASPFCPAPLLHPGQVTVLGWTKASRCSEPGVNSVSLADVRRKGAGTVIREILAAIPASANILVHFDTDVLADREFPATYFPHSDGFTMQQAGEVLGPLLADDRVRIVEISEYSMLRDLERVWINKLVETLSAALRKGPGPG